MRSDTTVRLVVQSSVTQYLNLGESTWMIFKSSVIAICDGVTVTFADVEHSRAAMKLINEWYRYLPHLRVPPDDFDYTVASTGIRALRPLLGRPSEPTTPEEGAKR